MKRRRLLLFIACLFSSPLLAGFTLNDEIQLVEKLRQGGLVIFFRHGVTAPSGEKVVPAEQLDDCSVQRNLSDSGITELKQMARAIDKLAIPVGKVYSSPYCRCRDTAQLLFGKATVSDALYFAIHLEKPQRQAVTLQLQQMLATPPAAGKNTVLVSHTGNLKEAADIWPKPEGVAHVFKPGKNGNFQHLGYIMPATWAMAASR